MSLSSAISNALSGMRATSAAADITGSNLANATNENYARRELVIQANTAGGRGGVEIVGVRRQGNPVMAATWRDANSEASMAQQQANDAAKVQSFYGEPTQAGSLANRLTQFQQSITAAAARPDLTERLGAAVVSLDTLVRAINDIGQGIQTQRETADREISNLAKRMNDILGNLETLNGRIVDASSQGKDVSSLLDQQDQLVDELSGITDVRVYPRDHNTIAIYSTGGTILLDNSAAEITFDATGVITANLTLAGGDLSALKVNGEPVTVGTLSGKIRGGQLGALFEFRDQTAVNEQAEIDSFAFELSQRLNDPSIDPTRNPGDVGFVTDGGTLVEAVNLVGLSNRLQVNSNINPMDGGDPRLLRDGLLAPASGPVGNAALLNSLSNQVTATAAVGHGAFAGELASLESLSVRQTNRTAYEMIRTQDLEVFSMTQSEALRAYKLETSVDSDAELQNLMMLEQAYAANAQVLRSVDEMMDVLLGIV